MERFLLFLYEVASFVFSGKIKIILNASVLDQDHFYYSMHSSPKTSAFFSLKSKLFNGCVIVQAKEAAAATELRKL